MILLDTHVVVWLAADEMSRFSAAAQELIEESDLRISPLVQVEIAYLNGIGRVTVPAETILSDLGSRIGMSVDQVSFGSVCAQAESMDWTRDLFDRLMAAHATIRSLPLLTKDQTLLDNLELATWPA